MRLLRQLLLVEARSAWEDQAEPNEAKFALDTDYSQATALAKIDDFEKRHLTVTHAKAGTKDGMLFIKFTGTREELEALVDELFKYLYHPDISNHNRNAYKAFIR